MTTNRLWPFSWPTAQTTEPPAVAPTALQSLRAQFADAAHVSYIRTCAYEPAQSNGVITEEWIEAFRVAPAHWLIKRKLKTPAADMPGGFAVSQSPYLNHGIVNFLQAVEILADYEASQEKLGLLPRTTPDITSAHFHGAAEREGLIFDANGLVHPTTPDGCTLGDAIFPGDAFEKARQAHKDKSPILARPVINPPLTIKLGNEIVDFLRPDLEDAEILAILHELRAFTDKACREGWHKSAKADPYYGTIDGRGGDAYWLIALDSRKLPDARARFKSTAGRMTKNKDLLEMMQRHYALLEFYILLCGARMTYEYLNVSIKVDGISIAPKKPTLDKYVQNIKSSLHTAGYVIFAQSSALIETLIRQEKAPQSCPREIEEIVTWFENLFKAIKTTPNAAPPPAAIMPIPKYIR